MKEFNSKVYKIKLDRHDHKHYELKYSSMQTFFDGVFEESKAKEIEYERHETDFWAFNLNPQKDFATYWTGYFSTNPEIKSQISKYSDFVQAATQLMSLSHPSDLESDQISSQDALLKTQSLMQHHDAITGTHLETVGIDYRKMMNETGSKSVKGPLGSQMTRMARHQGIEVDQVTQCTVEGTLSLNCSLDFNQTKTNVISVYNSNVDAVHGLFLNVTKGRDNLKVVLMDSDIIFEQDIEALSGVETELLCLHTPYVQTESDDGQGSSLVSDTKCEIFVDIAIEGLTLIHLGVTEMPGVGHPIETRQAYQYQTKLDKVLEPMSSTEKVHLDNKTLTLKQINRFMQRSMSLTFESGNGVPLDFEFSIETKSNYEGYITGHYMMTVKEQ